MPRTKGSKNKPKTVTADLQHRLRKSSPQRKPSLLRLHLSPQTLTLWRLIWKQKGCFEEGRKEVASLEAKKEKADAKAAEEAKKAEAESVLKKLLAEGMSADEILAKLK